MPSTSSIIAWFFGISIGGLVLLGVVPFLISSTDTFSVFCGFGILALTALGIVLYVNHLIKKARKNLS